MTSIQKNVRGQAGFTLVELAIVMIIIGLLIAGVLKGQALIENAKVTATVAQVKGIDAATTTFHDMYAGLPGDITTPTTRLPNCAAAPCSQAGNGDGVLAVAPGAAITTASENVTYFSQLAAAGLLTGINNVGNTLGWGYDLPAAKINGGWDVGSTPGNVGLTLAAEPAAATRGGLYLVLQLTAGAVASAANQVISTNDLARIDTKMDDGVATSGDVFPFGTVATCWIGASGLYAEICSR